MNRNRIRFVAARIIVCVTLVCVLSVGMLLYQKYMYANSIHSDMTVLYYCVIAVMAVLTLLSIIESIRLIGMLIYRDYMTLLPNAAWVSAKASRLFATGKLVDCKFFFLNIRDCKYYNDKYGTRFGDAVIIRYAAKLSELVGKNGYVARMGGDNFALIIRRDDVDRVLDRILSLYIQVPATEGMRTINVKCRCGICSMDKADSFYDIINFANIAMSYAKECKTDYEYYTVKMVDWIREEKTVLAEYRGGMTNDEFIPFYQPKVDVNTGKLCGAEALVRWVKDGKILSPYKFIPVLEKTQKITELDFYMLDKVCQDIQSWNSQGISPVSVSINFSKNHLYEEDFVEKVKQVLAKYNVNSNQIEIELTESTGCDDFELLNRFTTAIKDAGIKISIDDFGTGYSSLSLLRGFNADVIKLDKSFLYSSINEDDNSKRFIKDIISMIGNQGGMSLCEGVETKEQLEFLKAANCNIVQGYYFDKPLPRKEYELRMLEPQYSI